MECIFYGNNFFLTAHHIFNHIIFITKSAVSSQNDYDGADGGNDHS